MPGAPRPRRIRCGAVEPESVAFARKSPEGASQLGDGADGLSENALSDPVILGHGRTHTLNPMSVATIHRWRGRSFDPVDECNVGEVVLHAADSWRVEDGLMLAHDLHRARFTQAVLQAAITPPLPPEELDAFWDAAMTMIARAGAGFPRVELRSVRGAPELRLLLREAPPRQRSIRLATHLERDPRTQPTVKGPDLDSMMRLRGVAGNRGVDELVIVSPNGYVVEGTSSALCWWVGDLLAFPAADLPRVDSVTARAVRALATATAVEIIDEHRTPAELDGYEIWAVNALHGIRVVTEWADGPHPAELPGRAQSWRDRLARLRGPLPGGQS